MEESQSGNDVLIGPGTYVWSQNHRFDRVELAIREQGVERAAVDIEDDVWIAARCVILPGVRIAKGTVVAAGAVVTRSTEPYTIVAGVPARMIGKREEIPVPNDSIIHREIQLLSANPSMGNIALC